MAKLRVTLNSAGMRALLQSDEVGAPIEAAARRAAPPGAVVSRQVGRSRQNIRIEDPASDALDREAKTGHLSRALGSVRL